MCTRKVGALRGVTALLAQCAGATLAAATARMALPHGAGLVTTVFWLGPVLGALLAALCHDLLLAPGAPRAKLGACLACRDVAPLDTPSPAPSSPSNRSPPAPPTA
ncbi:hypothetical protein Q9233_013759 [Columba guinea]|nr:hypothetical protein Q9233_013759 [Columba guinea]